VNTFLNGLLSVCVAWAAVAAAAAAAAGKL